MADDRRQVRQAVHSLITSLEAFRDCDPTVSIGEAAASDFNLILTTAKRAFPDSFAVQHLRPLDVSGPLIALMTKIATLKGAVDSES